MKTKLALSAFVSQHFVLSACGSKTEGSPLRLRLLKHLLRPPAPEAAASAARRTLPQLRAQPPKAASAAKPLIRVR